MRQASVEKYQRRIAIDPLDMPSPQAEASEEVLSRSAMNLGVTMMRKAWVLALVMFGLLWALQPAAVAAAPTTETIHYEEQRIEMDVVCSGAVVPIQIDAKGVVHVTDFGDGRYHFTFTEVGTFLAVDAGVTYTGRFTVWGGENSNSKNFNGTFTFSARGKGSDGSRLLLQGVAHFTVSATGEVTSEFERFTVTC
jgi:hypothetical protein